MFKVGQQVICVDASPPDFLGGIHEDLLVRGRIYTIRRLSLRAWDNVPLVHLAGVNEHYPYNGWRANRFRPLVEKKTDISVFKALLVPKEEKADV